MKTNYPYIRVIIFFTLCPLLCGFIYGVIGFGTMVLYTEPSYAEYKSFSSMVAMFLLLPVAGALTGLFYFGVPACIASVIYAALRLHKTWYNYLFVAVAGGGAAHLWLPVMFSSKYVSWELTNIFHGTSALGALSSLFMAYLVLPTKSILSSH